MNKESDTTQNNLEEWKCINCGKINKGREYCINCNAKKCEIYRNLEADVYKYSFKCKKCDSDINFDLIKTQLANMNIKCNKCGEEYKAVIKMLDPDNVEVYNSNDEKIYTLKYIRNIMFTPNSMDMVEFMNIQKIENKTVTDEPWKCDACGFDNPQGKFCRNCGMPKKVE